jgi:hypothetical protein
VLICCIAYVAYWHIATIWCDVQIRSLLEAQRTCRERRERTDAALLTPERSCGVVFCCDARHRFNQELL